MSNYGIPNGKNKGGQSAPVSSGQSPYNGYQQTGYQTGGNPPAYQRVQNSGEIPNPYPNTYPGYGQYSYPVGGQNTNPGYAGGMQNTNPGYAGNGQNTNPGYASNGQNANPGYSVNGQTPYFRQGTQMPYNPQPQYPQGYPNPMQNGQSQPYAGNAYNPYGNPQRPYAGAQPAYTGPQNGQQGYPYSAPQAPVNGGYPYQGQIPPQGYAAGPQQGGYARNNPQQKVTPPAQKPKRNLPIEPEWLIVIIGAVVLAALFIASLLVAAPVLKWLFLACAVVSLAYIWVRPVLNQGPKLTASVLIGVAALVTVLSMVLTPSTDRTTDTTNRTATKTTVVSAEEELAAAAIEEEGNVEQAAESVEVNIVTPTPDTTSATLENLSSFFYFWSVNSIDNMLNYCAPSWVSKQEDPRVALFQVLSNRIAKSYTLGTPTGTDNDISRTVAVTATVDKQNGDNYSIFVYNVIMLKENETWYVDPRSLQSHEEVEATTFSAVITQPPTPQPAEASMILYYNPDGGSYYHADANCEAVAEKYRPLSGTFTFGQINEPAYANLKCCQRCAAPMRTNR